MEFHRTNYNTYEAQNFTEQTSHAYERTINFSEFICSKNRSNKFNKIQPHIAKLIRTESSITFLDPIF